MIQPATSATPKYSFELLTGDDPNLAIAGLRIEIEKALKRIAQLRSLPSAPFVSATRVADYLVKSGVLSEHEGEVIRDLLAILNRAVHGATVEPYAAEWASKTGRSILEALEQRANQLSRSIEGGAMGIMVQTPRQDDG